MTFSVILVLAVIFGMIISLYFDLVRPVFLFFSAVLIFFLFDVLKSEDLLAGFANEQIAVIFMLLFLSDILRRGNVLESFFSSFFHDGLGYRKFMAKMTGSVSLMSGLVNNTPLVAILMPYVYDWAKRKNISPSKVLIPLSYATIMGGTITLVGTSTNLVVNGFYVESGHESLGLFDFTIIGLPLTIIGVLFLVLFSWRLLPDRKDALGRFRESQREYIVETMVPKDSGIVGRSIEEAGLRNLKGLFLVEVIRGEKRLAPVSPKEIIEGGDKLIFAGQTETIVDLVQKNYGLVLPDQSQLPDREHKEIVEVVISAQSTLDGSLVKDSNFRGRFDAAIVAVNRNGERITGKLGEVRLKEGDLLLLVAGPDFSASVKSSNDLYLISQVKEIRQVPAWKSVLFIGSMVAAFGLSAFGIFSLFKGLLLVMAVIGLLRLVKFQELKNAFDVDLFLVLVFALAIGKSIHLSGADNYLAQGLLQLAGPFNSKVMILALLYLCTNILAMLVTNKAAVAITFPIAMALCSQLGISDPTPFVLAIAFAGSAEFMTPYGYQTNLMVYGPGGYKFKDYMRIGWGLSLLFFITTVLLLSWHYDLY